MDPKFREGMAQLAPLGYEFRILAVSSATTGCDRPGARRSRTPRSSSTTSAAFSASGRTRAIAQEILADWRKHIAELAKCPNVNMKLGGLGMVSVGFDFHERDVPPSSEDLAAAWRPYIEPCIEAFGVDRCMFESNFPPDKQSCGYTELWNAFKRITVRRLGRGEESAVQRHCGAGVSHYRALISLPGGTVCHGNSIWETPP